VLGDVVEGGLHALRREQFARGLEHALPIAFGVLAQPSAWFVNHHGQFSDLRNGRP
jgi:hypothetical protein